jgi:hypothetical protein
LLGLPLLLSSTLLHVATLSGAAAGVRYSTAGSKWFAFAHVQHRRRRTHSFEKKSCVRSKQNQLFSSTLFLFCRCCASMRSNFILLLLQPPPRSPMPTTLRRRSLDAALQLPPPVPPSPRLIEYLVVHWAFVLVPVGVR